MEPESMNVRGVIEVRRTPSLTEEHNAERREDNAQESKKYRIEQVTLFFVIVVAALTFAQVWLSGSALSDSKQQFTLDQRPYVWETGQTPPDAVHIVDKERVTVDVGWINYGKSPAINVKSVGVVELGIPKVSAMDLADMFVENLDTGRSETFERRMKALDVPQMQIDLLQQMAGAGAKALVADKSNLTIIPPGLPADLKHPFGGTVVIRSMEPPQDVNYVLNTDRAMVAFTRISYDDLSGHHYWSDLCLIRAADGSIAKCERHNEMH